VQGGAKRWIGHFSFVYYKGVAEDCAEIASQFCEMARDALEKEYWGPCIDALFSASELAAKALLLCWQELEVVHAKKHTLIHNRLNMHRKIGNAREDQVKTFNALSKLRYPARYLQTELDITETEARAHVEHVEEMIATARKWLSS